MKSATIILWILCLVVAVGASAVGAQGPAGAIAFWLAFVFLWTGIALRLRGSVLARWGGAFLITLLVQGLVYVFLASMVAGGASVR